MFYILRLSNILRIEYYLFPQQHQLLVHANNNSCKFGVSMEVLLSNQNRFKFMPRNCRCDSMKLCFKVRRDPNGIKALEQKL